VALKRAVFPKFTGGGRRKESGTGDRSDAWLGQKRDNGCIQFNVGNDYFSAEREDRDSSFLRNVCELLPDYTASHPRML
jgi:hypothetical protein